MCRKETYEQWLARIQPKLNAITRRSLPMKFYLSNHLGSGRIELATGELGTDPVTGLVVAVLTNSFAIYNPHATGDKPAGEDAPYKVNVVYETSGTV